MSGIFFAIARVLLVVAGACLIFMLEQRHQLAADFAAADTAEDTLNDARAELDRLRNGGAEQEDIDAAEQAVINAQAKLDEAVDGESVRFHWYRILIPTGYIVVALFFATLTATQEWLAWKITTGILMVGFAVWKGYLNNHLGVSITGVTMVALVSIFSPYLYGLAFVWGISDTLMTIAAIAAIVIPILLRGDDPAPVELPDNIPIVWPLWVGIGSLIGATVFAVVPYILWHA